MDGKAVGGEGAPGCAIGQGELIEQGKLLNEANARHVRVLMGGLQMRHGCERVNTVDLVPPHQLLLQVRRHQQRALQTLRTEIGRVRSDVARRLVSQIRAADKNQIELVCAQWRSRGRAATAASQQAEHQCQHQSPGVEGKYFHARSPW